MHAANSPTALIEWNPQSGIRGETGARMKEGDRINIPSVSEDAAFPPYWRIAGFGVTSRPRHVQ